MIMILAVKHLLLTWTLFILDSSSALQSHCSSSTAPLFEQCIVGSHQLSYSLWAELVSVCWYLMEADLAERQEAH